MEKVPQIVRERLKSAMPVANHPDADVLTAFAERSLPELERAMVLEHLSRCGDCREVVALALPETAPVPQLAPSRAGWLTWPALRWGFALAGVVVIASLGVVQFGHRAPSNLTQKASAKFASLAKNEAVPAPATSAKEAATATAGKQESKLQVPDALTTDADKPGTTVNSERHLAPLPQRGLTVGGPVRGTLTHGPRLANQYQLNQQSNSQNAFVAVAPPSATTAPPVPPQVQNGAVANSPVPAQSEMVRVEAAAPAIEANKLDLQNQPLSKSEGNDGYAESKVEKTKPAETVVTIGPSKVLASASPSLARSFDSFGSPRWAISSYGTLQRSFDQGASWQDVSVKGSVGGAVAGMMVTREAATAEKRAAPARAKDATKQSAAFETPIVFRAVAALGNEVWAGGTAGKLYHSIDAGTHWTQVVPTSGNVSLNGDIVRLEFSDPQHGRVTTSAPEVWVTSDGGQTWQKQ